MARGRRGNVYKRCGCRDAATGKRKGPGCDLLRRPLHGSWYLSLEVPAGAAGERRRIRLGGHRSRRQAEAALRVLQTPCSTGGTAAWTTGRWLRHWLTGRVSFRPSTRRMYESHLRLYLLPYLDRTPLAALTIGEVRAMFLAIGRQHHALGALLSATTLHSIRCTLRAALNAAIREGLLTDNPARWSSRRRTADPTQRCGHPPGSPPGKPAARARRSRSGPPPTPPASSPPSKGTRCARCCIWLRCGGCAEAKQQVCVGRTPIWMRER